MDELQQADLQVPVVKNTGQPRILVAPLDWGLGHATRCIPIINQLLKENCEVFLCGEGQQQVLLKQEFPGLQFIELKGYRVAYGKNGPQLIGNIFRQAPRILRSIKQENEWLKNAIDQYQLDAVISDNRFGLSNKAIPSVFITHQLGIKTGLGKWLNRVVQKRNYKYINKFDECWVPDQENEANLAGELSHPVKLPGGVVKYIGSLSRFSNKDAPFRRDHLLVIISGPEPQRSIFENLIVSELGTYAATATVVRGLPGTESIIPSSNMIRFYNHLDARELEQQLAEAEFVIGRSGYSTIMDLITLRKKSILVPTPGQPEQEYLGEYLHKRKMIICIKQKQFHFSSALANARQFEYRLPVIGLSNNLEETVGSFVKKLRK